ncbi:MAG: cytochrome P450 [Dehalococcoidia bacterium]
MVTASDFGYDVFDQNVVAKPHPIYEKMRLNAPIVWSEQHDGWILTQYQDVHTVLRDPDLFAKLPDRPVTQAGGQGNPQQHREMMTPLGTKNMLNVDEPDHKRLRRVLERDFTPRKIADLEPHVYEVADRLLEGASQRDQFDVMDELAVPLPVTMIAELLGIPPEQGADFKRWSDASTHRFPPNAPQSEIDERNAAVIEFREYLKSQIDQRRISPTDDFIGRLVAAHDEEDALDDNELLAAINLLLLAGNETTTSLIGNGVLALLRNPDQLEMLRNDESMFDAAVDEFLRYDGTVQNTSRTAMRDVEFHGQKVKSGELLVIMLASANRDETIWENGEQFDITRERGNGRHLAFGDWIHICLGQFLARVETKAALKALLREFPTMESVLPFEEIPYRTNHNLRGLLHFPVRNA